MNSVERCDSKSNVLALGLAWPYGEAHTVYFDYFELFLVAAASISRKPGSGY
jgi:hypothetical protein